MFISDDFPMTMEREFGLPPHYPPMAVGFGMAPLLDDEETAKKGFEVYRDVLFVKIATPGDRTSLYFQPAQDSHKKRFPHAWGEYTKRETRAGQEGLPVEQWAQISRSTALNLKVVHIHTVEALAEMGDDHIGNVSSGRELRERARLFLKQRADASVITKVASEKQQLKDQIEALQNQINGLKMAGAVSTSVPAPLTSPHTADEAHTNAIQAEVVKAARRPRARASA
jgi:hypothetical protein